MSALDLTLAVAGPISVAGAWVLIRSRRASLWVVNGIFMPVLGTLSLLTGLVELSSEKIGAGWAVTLGIGAGLGLYAATAAFMAVARRWPVLARHTSALYENRRDISLPAAIGISALLVAPGEELLWRGVVLEALRSGTDSAAVAAVLAWLAYIAANAASGSVPIVLGAVVSGAVWTLLAACTGAVIASIACHVVWTALMVSLPPVPRAVR
ncbi:MAG: CPBP family glutamic-type intramembrane protease [Actinomycetota bacterium]